MEAIDKQYAEKKASHTWVLADDLWRCVFCDAVSIDAELKFCPFEGQEGE